MVRSLFCLETYRCRSGAAAEPESEKVEATTARLKSIVVFISDGGPGVMVSFD